MAQELNLLEETLEFAEESDVETRDQEIKRIIEALLFSSSEAITLDKLREIIQTTYPIRSRELRKFIDEMSAEYLRDKRAFQIDEVAGGFLLRTIAPMRSYVEQLIRDRRSEKLSHAAKEVLAIVAYKQPITKREIEAIRGVDSSGSIASLQERGLIEPIGRKEAPGRPIQFGITKRFLQHFGLKNRTDLADMSSTK